MNIILHFVIESFEMSHRNQPNPQSHSDYLQ